jgi:uncharacterized small protein (DUF1192 family)
MMNNKFVHQDGGQTEAIKTMQERLLLEAELQGKQDGANNKPATVHDYRVGILNKVQTTVQAFIDDNQQHHLPVSSAAIASKKKLANEKTINGLQARLNDVTIQLQAITAITKKNRPDGTDNMLRMVLLPLVILIGGADGWFSYDAWRNMSIQVAGAVAASFGVGIAVGIGAHLCADFIKKATDPLYRYLRYGGILTLYLAGFYFISYQRASVANYSPGEYAQALTQYATPNPVSAWTITLISFLLFWFALFTSLKLWRSPEELQKCRAYKEAEKERLSLLGEKKELESKIASLQKDTERIDKDTIGKLDFAKSVESSLVSFAQLVLGRYAEANILYRPDNTTPDFYSHSQQIRFKTYFTNSKNNDYEKNGDYYIELPRS